MNIGEQLDNWMAELPDELQNYPVIHLAIPGSHDSGSYSVDRNSPISPDAIPFVQRLGKIFGPVVKRFIFRWSITQHLSVTEQLYQGVRYLDLRVSTMRNTKELFIVHGLYGTTVNNILSDVQKFITEHSRELVILDFQHFYQFTAEDHSALMTVLHQMFGDHMVPLTHPLHKITLNYITSVGRRVIVLYRDAAGAGIPTLWPPSSWPTPWPETTNVTAMFGFLQQRMERRRDICGLVVQCVLTPDVKYVLLHPFTTLQKSLAAMCNRAVAMWIPQQHAGGHGVNVAISDFVDSSFCREVIKLNYKLLSDTSITG